MPEYSPSVFSRMRTVLTSSYGVLKPWMEAQGRTLANRLKVRRRVKLRDTWPLPTGSTKAQHMVGKINRGGRTWCGKRTFITITEIINGILREKGWELGTFQGDCVFLYRLNCVIWDDSLPAFEDRCNADFFPLNRHLCRSLVNRSRTDNGFSTWAATYISLIDWLISGPMPE